MTIIDSSAAGRLTRALRTVLEQAKALAAAGDTLRLAERISLAQAIVRELAGCLAVDEGPQYGDAAMQARAALNELEDITRQIRPH